MATMPPLCTSIIIIILAVSFLLAHHPQPASAQRSFSSLSSRDSPWTPSQRRFLVPADASSSNFTAGFQRSGAGLYVFGVWVEKASDKAFVWSLQGVVNSSSLLTVSPSGVLTLYDSSGGIRWRPPQSSNNSELKLNSDGSLSFGDWSSFNLPNDTILANQNVPANGTTLRSGRYSLVNATSLAFDGTDTYWSTTNQNAIQNLTSDGILQLDKGATYIASDKGDLPLRRLTLGGDGNLRIYSLDSSTGNWTIVWQAVQQTCQIHGICGANAICNTNRLDQPVCACAPGYRNTSSGCALKLPILNRSKFLELDFVDFQDAKDKYVELPGMDFSACQSRCLGNATCVAFGYKYDGTQYCVHRTGPLLNGYWSPGTQIATYLRVAEAETDRSNYTGMTSILDTVCPVQITLPDPPSDSKNTARNVGIISTVFTIELLAGFLSFWAFLRKYSRYRDMARTFGLEFLPAGGPKRFTYAELKAATNNFSNILGRGGFGVVYKGELSDHRTVAVKRLRDVAGGEQEFWAEVTIIARMHHLNLVRMWGFCAEKQQRLLVYEYVPNGSLDKYLFPPSPTAAGGDQARASSPPRPLLDWNIRYRIAVGVARAVAYLHEECLEWVLHCDIKPENILLTGDFCPKVADFGLAKLTDKEEKVKMSRIRGTRGYMAPEFVIRSEPITAKADVYSFGMVLLDIVSGIRNFDFRRTSLYSEDCYLPTWAFEKVYEEKNIDDILDKRIADSYDSHIHFELVDRMVKTAMWCLQDRPEMRPSMGKVTKMLEGTVEIIQPGKPTLLYGGGPKTSL